MMRKEKAEQLSLFEEFGYNCSESAGDFSMNEKASYVGIIVKYGKKVHQSYMLKILQALPCGHEHPIPQEGLTNLLGVSRTVVKNVVKEMQQMGIPVDSNSGNRKNGYFLCVTYEEKMNMLVKRFKRLKNSVNAMGML